MRDIETKIPVLFEKLEEHKVEDTRFMKVKIFLLHLGANLNGSYFSKKVVNEALPSLANTPILGYPEINKSGEDDFSDHRRIVERKSTGEFIYKNAGIPFGLIPENNNAQYEMRLCDDGVTREFLTVEGLLWTKWHDSIDIMGRDFVKNQSMELHSEYEGFTSGVDSLFHFTKFSFYGACILGIDHNPAMKNSTIELQFELNNKEELECYIQDKVEQFKLFSLMNIKNQEGREGMNKKLELLIKFSKTEEDIKALNIDLEEISLEDLEIKLQDIESTEEVKVEAEEIEVETEEENKDIEETEEVEFETDETVEEETIEVETVEVEAEEKTVDAEEEKEKEISFEDLQIKYATLKTAFNDLKETSSKLQEFKDARLKADRKISESKLFSEFEMLIGIKEFEDIKTNSTKYESIEDLEKEIALVFARNRNKIAFSNSEDDKDKISFSVDKPINDKNTKYGDLFERFGK